MFLENFVLIAQQVLVLFILIAVGFACGKAGVITEHASKKMTDNLIPSKKIGRSDLSGC